jgi:electron transport complex protein RnfA
MSNKFLWFLTLAVFSGLSMNLILQLGIGLQRIAMGDDSRHCTGTSKEVFFVWPVIYFISIMILWLFFSVLRSVLFLGFFEYILVFPVSFLFFTGIGRLFRCLAKRRNEEPVFNNCFIRRCLFIDSLIADADESSPNSAFSDGDAPVNGAMAGAALFIILGLSGGFAQTAALCFGFSAGAALAVLIMVEIRRRSVLEAVPRSLRGVPLVLVTLGLLSLVFTSIAAVF